MAKAEMSVPRVKASMRRGRGIDYILCYDMIKDE